MTKRDEQILPPSTLRAVDEWDRESEIGPKCTGHGGINDHWAHERTPCPVHSAKPARHELYPSRAGVSTMPSPAERKLTSRQFVAALAAAFAVGWGAVELVRWVVE